MIIFKNGFITLSFDPATDILSFDMPDVDSVVMPEMKRSLDIIVDHTRNYNVKRILLDARNSHVWVEEEDYADIIAEFYLNLASTRVERVARIVKLESKRENIIKRMLDAVAPNMEIQRFTESTTGKNWLLTPDLAG